MCVALRVDDACHLSQQIVAYTGLCYGDELTPRMDNSTATLPTPVHASTLVLDSVGDVNIAPPRRRLAATLIDTTGTVFSAVIPL
jgi:hypothetical protein